MLKKMFLNKAKIWYLKKSTLFFIMYSLFLCMLFNTCVSETNSKSDVLLFDLERESKISVKDIFQDIRVIPLSIDSNKLIAQIRQVDYYENIFYVFDQVSQTLLCFDQNGNLQQTIGRQGNGPGEYFYATNFAIDPFNRQILFLSPSAAQITIYGLDGVFIEQKLIKEVLGYNSIIVMNDSVLLLNSATQYQSLLYNRRTQNIFNKFFKFPEADLHHLTPGQENTYRFNQEVFVLPAMQQKIYNLSDLEPKIHTEFSFGSLNNTKNQWEGFFNESNRMPANETLRMHRIIGKDGVLNSHVLKISEVDRYQLMMVVCETTVKHAIFDKKMNKTYVFEFFAEKTVINPLFLIKDNYMIAFETRNYQKERAKEFYQHLFPYHDADFFSNDYLSEKCKEIIENHDPMTDNPFLVVYKFKE